MGANESRGSGKSLLGDDKQLTLFSARRDNGRQVEDHTKGGVEIDVVPELFGSPVADKLEEPDLVVDDEESHIGLVNTNVVELGSGQSDELPESEEEYGLQMHEWQVSSSWI